MANNTLIIQMPTTPEELAVTLPPADLRRIDFSALDFDSLRRVMIEYIQAYYPEEFNDFVANNGVIMLMELMAYVGGVLSQRSDILVDESFLPTARSLEAISNHLALINQVVRRATPATVDVEVTIDTPLPVEVRIPAGITFSLTGGDGLPLTYEIFRTPGDFSSYISIPANKRGVVAYGIEGQFGTPVIVTSTGGPDQTVNINSADVLDEPIFVDVLTGEELVRWHRVDKIEMAGPNEEAYEVRHLEDSTDIVFGDDVSGKSPLSGQEIQAQYRIGGGIRGRIGATTINETRPISPQPPASAVVEVRFRNPTPSVGGRDAETKTQAKKRAPREFATQDRAVSGEDYAQLAADFSHPVYGSVLKAVGTIRTGIEPSVEEVAKEVRAAATLEEATAILEQKWVNRNIPELYVLAEGANGAPVVPSTGLKNALVTFFSDINVLTDEVRILDGGIKSVDVDMTIVMSKNADASTVKNQVTDALADFFDIENWDMGEGLYISNLYDTIQSIPGVKFLRIYKPTGDIKPSDDISPSGTGTEDVVGINEIISIGSQDIRFFFERGRR